MHKHRTHRCAHHRSISLGSGISDDGGHSSDHDKGKGDADSFCVPVVDYSHTVIVVAATQEVATLVVVTVFTVVTVVAVQEVVVVEVTTDR